MAPDAAIPNAAIPDAAVPVTPFSLGLGLTNECNLACSFCYRDPTRTDRLTLEQVRDVMARLPVRSVNLGTGENGMHPEFRAMLAYLRTQPVKLTITSNGHSIALLTDEDLTAFADVEFSLDYATRAEQDAQRSAAPAAAAWPPCASPRARPCSPASIGPAAARRWMCCWALGRHHRNRAVRRRPLAAASLRGLRLPGALPPRLRWPPAPA